MKIEINYISRANTNMYEINAFEKVFIYDGAFSQCQHDATEELHIPLIIQSFDDMVHMLIKTIEFTILPDALLTISIMAESPDGITAGACITVPGNK